MVKTRLVEDLSDTQDSLYMSSFHQNRQRTEVKMMKLSSHLLAKLFTFTMLDFKPDHLARCPHNGGHYALREQPG